MICCCPDNRADLPTFEDDNVLCPDVIGADITIAADVDTEEREVHLDNFHLMNNLDHQFWTLLKTEFESNAVWYDMKRKNTRTVEMFM
ncbi:unnamed protein product [Acanthoscelides obtectus]|uniref:Uncharacterized protein n=1 Tax=Acanthoscelides obtectus TaxID=200917 RepID=A0A9P0PFR7_ACAOB|nr:unnamed protein product [Acanthoscelides obtectus]CAK1631231.1 hypothetical protein AOBTE_LOCUS6825 [Acanthoscelides obtectus]